jgi:hypothetical protein
MASFASYRRSGWVRLLVLILCALFIFATLGAPPAQALGVESVAVFGLASVLSAATAALGFKLSSDEQGQATLQKMVQDFKTVAWATGFVLVGSKLNGLQNGMDYIKMQIANGKTYLDSRVFAWVQQWLAKNGVYDSGSSSIDNPSYVVDQTYKITLVTGLTYSQLFTLLGVSVGDWSPSIFNTAIPSNTFVSVGTNSNKIVNELRYWTVAANYDFNLMYTDGVWFNHYDKGFVDQKSSIISYGYMSTGDDTWADKYNTGIRVVVPFMASYLGFYGSNVGQLSEPDNNTGLSGVDTLGKDVVDLTLDQVLEKLKEWAQDWYDAGADSATNAAAGAKDLPLTVATGAATANPSIAEDGPLVWFPPFSIPIPNLRTGETDSKTVDQGKENASAVETSTVDVAENQTVIDSLVNWALSYISPDTGLFSKFPLCVPYDAYLLVTSSLGVDAVGSDSIFGASPGDLDGVVSQDTETYSDFQPIINIKHDFELDGVNYPLDVTIDLTPWQPLVTFFREGMALLLVAELIGAEFKRIRGH